MDIDLVFQTEVLGNATPVFSENECGMRFIDHDPGIVALAKINDLRQYRQITIHRVHAFNHNQFLADRAFQFLFQVIDPVMPEKADPGLRQDDPVNDTGMRILIRDHRIARSHQPGYNTEIGAIASGKKQRGFFLFEFGQLLRQLHV